MKLENETVEVNTEALDFSRVKTTWSSRHLLQGGLQGRYYLQTGDSEPRIGDVALVQVERLGHHGRIDTESGARLRLYPGDRMVCVFGNRYATDVYEGRVRDLKPLHLLTSSGLVGTVVSRHRDIMRPTPVSFLGYVVDDSGARVNTKELLFHPIACEATPDLILVVGTGMNTGKTTVTRKILRGLISRGVRAAGCKLTGTTSPRDLRELVSTGPIHAMDFSECGLPSTYGATQTELLQLLHTMLKECSRKGAEVVVMEIADGFLQQETQLLLQSECVRSLTSGVVLAGACSGSALSAAEYLRHAGFDVWAASGLMTNSPLFMREFSRHSSVPVASSSAIADKLVNIVMKNLAHVSREVAAKVTT